MAMSIAVSALLELDSLDYSSEAAYIFDWKLYLTSA